MVAKTPERAPATPPRSVLGTELRQDRAIWVALAKGPRELLVRLPAVGPVIAGFLVAAESLAVDATEPEPDESAAVAALLQAHDRELASRQEQLAASEAQVRALTQAVRDLARAGATEPSAEIAQAEADVLGGDPARARSFFAGLWQRAAEAGLAANREAARAARHVAAFDALASTEKALLASTSATELDPESADGWLLHASLLLRAGRIDAARQAYQQALDLAAGNASITLIAHVGLGDVAVLQGDLAKAVIHVDEASTITQRLVDERPDDPVRLHNLSALHDRSGNVQRARGDLEAALRAYQESLAIAERLATQEPSHSDWQRDLIVSNVKLAEVAESHGLVEDARRHYRAAQDVAVALH